ncbi:ABC transporter ATP-binding protein [bacterium]|nr:ABC transporter ATP-binding protein [bacterium]
MNRLIPAMALTIALMTAWSARAEDHLKIMLDWFVNPDHAPIIVARQRGYFKDEGLDVDIIAPADPADPPKMVAAGQVDLAVGYQPQLYLQEAAGLPVVRVGALVDNPLYCVMVDAAGPVATLSDLKGRRIGFSVPGIEEALLHRMLQHDGVAPSDVSEVNVNFALTSALASGSVDAVAGAFRNFEPHQMQSVEHEGRCFLPEEHGVPPYDELIYLANPATMDRDRITRFLKATARAAREIAADPAAGWSDFRSYAPELDDALNAAAWKDTVPHLAQDPFALDAARYAAFGQFMAEAGLISAAPDVARIAVSLK